MAVETAPPPHDLRDERVARVGFLTRLLKRPEVGALFGVLAVFFLFAAAGNGFGATGFGSIDGTSNWSDVASLIAIMAVPVALLMIGGEFDLSAGVMIGSSGILFALLTADHHWNVWTAFVVTMLFGLAVGFFNGMLVVKTRLPSFIVTLATFFILQGLNQGGLLSLTGKVYVPGVDEAPGYSGARKVFASTIWSPHDLQIRVFWCLAITAIAQWILVRTRVGNWIFAVGGDATAARNVGVPVLRTKVGLFMAVSTMAALSGVMRTLQLREIEGAAGIGLEFQFIIAAVVGGCLLTGGYGSAIGALMGAMIMGMTTSGVVYANWKSDYFFLFLGVILLLAVLLNTWISRRAASSRR
jgi:simple sugar transport system permease protein